MSFAPILMETASEEVKILSEPCSDSPTSVNLIIEIVSLSYAILVLVWIWEQGEYKQETEQSSQHMAKIQTVTHHFKLGWKHPFYRLLFWRPDSESWWIFTAHLVDRLSPSHKWVKVLLNNLDIKSFEVVTDVIVCMLSSNLSGVN